MTKINCKAESEQEQQQENIFKDIIRSNVCREGSWNLHVPAQLREMLMAHLALALVPLLNTSHTGPLKINDRFANGTQGMARSWRSFSALFPCFAWVS